MRDVSRRPSVSRGPGRTRQSRHSALSFRTEGTFLPHRPRFAQRSLVTQRTSLSLQSLRSRGASESRSSLGSLSALTVNQSVGRQDHSLSGDDTHKSVYTVIQLYILSSLVLHHCHLCQASQVSPAPLFVPETHGTPCKVITTSTSTSTSTIITVSQGRAGEARLGGSHSRRSSVRDLWRVLERERWSTI